MNQDLLTQKVIEGCIIGTDGGRQNGRIVLVLAIIMFVLGACMFFVPIITVICWAIAVLALILRHNSFRVIKCMQNKKYVLRKDVCVNKYAKRDSEGTDTYYLVFEAFGRREIHFPHAVMNSTAYRKTPDVYQATEIGDSVYLLLTPKDKLLYIFNCRFWELETAEFDQTENTFSPRCILKEK